MDKQLQTVHIYNKYVENYINKFMNFDLYNDTFDDFLNFLPQGSSLLELGCGPGNVIKYFLDRRKDLYITGVDLAPEMIVHAKRINPTAAFACVDIRKVQQIQEKYTGIVGAFCLPYLSYTDLPDFFKNANHLMLPEGWLYLSCMEGKEEQSGFEKTSFTGDSEMYIYYHQRTRLEQLLHAHGFEILHFYTKAYPESDGSATTDLIYIARKLSNLQ